MKKNIGKKDRVLRLIIALFFLGLAWWYWSWISLAVGLFTLYEAFAGWCLWYQIIGKSSCDLDQK